MVCQLSELHLKEGSSLITTKERMNKQESRLEHELAFLFGREVVEQSQKISIDQMYVEADLVAEGARQLLAHIGEPEAQRRIIEGMDNDTALALCKWISEALWIN
jgi:hypothetical protein